MKFKKLLISLLVFIILFSVVVYADNEPEEQIDLNEIQQEVIQTSSNTSEEPEINSRAAVVIDRNSKTILYGKAETEQRKMASTTKIMTAIVVIENANLYDTVTVSKKAAGTGGSRLGIHASDKITVCDLLYGLLLKSGNDTAIALAEYVGGSIEGFAELMNKKAVELNLTNTHFVTPHGLDNDNHYTTAYELAILTDYALQNKTFSNFVETKSYTITINGVPKSINNTNELLGNLNGVYGVKTGFTNGANRCLVTSCKRGDLDIICVVLGADSKKFRTRDSIKLIEYCFNTYEVIDLEQIVNSEFNNWKETNLSTFNINKGSSNSLQVGLKDFSYKLYPIKKGTAKDLSININCNYIHEAPLNAGTTLGTLCVNIGDNTVLKFDIVNTITIDKKSTLDYLHEMFENYFEFLMS